MARWDSDAQSPLSWSLGNREALFRLILSGSLDAIVTFDQYGLILDWNGAAEELFGRTAEEAFGRHLSELILPERDRGAFEDAVAEFLRTGDGPLARRRIELMALRRDGDALPVELTLSPLRGGNGWLFTAFIRDLTERRRMAARLEAQNSVLRILGTAPDRETAEMRILESICSVEDWHFGAYWRVEDGGLACEAIHARGDSAFPRFAERTRALRLGRDEGLPGRIWSSGQPQWIRDLAGAEGFPRLEAARAEGLRSAFGFPVRAGGRTYGIFEFLSVKALEPDRPLMEILASLSGQVALFQARKEAEAERELLLAQREADERRWRQLLDWLPIPLVQIEPGSGRILFSNRATDALSGAAPRVDSAEGYAEAFPCVDAEGRPIPNDEMPGPRAARGETVTNFELTWRAPGRDLTLLVNSAAVPGPDGRPEAVVMTTQDISPLKEMESQLHLSQRVEALGQLAGGIAHDFNNLLTAINGFSALALDGLDPGAPAARHLAEVRKAGERASDLTRQLLLFSRKQAAQARALSLDEVVSGMEPLLRRLIVDRVDLELSLDGNLPPVRADRGQLEQVILNLALNARDAMPEGGRLVLATSRHDGPLAGTLLRKEAAGRPHAVLSVSDSGHGMAPEVAARIFEPYFTTKAPGKGTGLGLPVVFGAVRRADGDIAVESAPGRGTVFRVYLPLDAPADPA